MNYAELMEKSDECTRKAIECFQNGEVELCNFWKNASEGYKNRALNLEIK